MLDKVLRRSDAIDKESLCILAGQRVSCLISFQIPDPHLHIPLDRFGTFG